MIDVENIIYTKVLNAVREKFPTCRAFGEAQDIPAEFPVFTLYESNNYVYLKTMSLDHEENHDVVTYDVNVYTNNATSKKQAAKDIATVIDAEMTELGLRRISRTYNAPNADKTVYRITMRYQALVSKPFEMDGGTYCQITKY